MEQPEQDSQNRASRHGKQNMASRSWQAEHGKQKEQTEQDCHYKTVMLGRDGLSMTTGTGQPLFRTRKENKLLLLQGEIKLKYSYYDTKLKYSLSDIMNKKWYLH